MYSFYSLDYTFKIRSYKDKQIIFYNIGQYTNYFLLQLNS